MLFGDSDTVTSRSVVVRAGLKNKSSSRGKMVLQHMTIINAGKSASMLNAGDVLGFGDDIVDGMHTVCTMRGPSAGDYFVKGRDLMCGL